MPSQNTSYNKQAMDNLANEIQRIKEEYSKIINELEKEIVELNAYWNDDASGVQTYQSFKSSFDKIKPQLEEGISYIEHFKTTVENQKERYQQAENKIMSNFE